MLNAHLRTSTCAHSRPIPKPAIAVIKREIKIQADLGQGHLNIVSAEEVVLSKTHLGLIMEFVPGAQRLVRRLP